LRLVHSHTDSKARNAGLRHFEERIADSIPITDTDIIIGKSVYREVFPKLTHDEVVAMKLLGPVMVRGHLIHKDRAVFSTMSLKVALTIAVDIETTNHSRAVNA
jgi:hypothetical protein